MKFNNGKVDSAKLFAKTETDGTVTITTNEPDAAMPNKTENIDRETAIEILKKLEKRLATQEVQIGEALFIKEYRALTFAIRELQKPITYPII